MTDDLERLRAALKSAPPAPDAARKAAGIAAAMAAFEVENAKASQGSADPVRPSLSRPRRARLMDGGISMIHALTSRAGLAATTGLVTVGLAVLLVLPQDLTFGPEREETLPELPAPAVLKSDLAREMLSLAEEPPAAAPTGRTALLTDQGVAVARAPTPMKSAAANDVLVASPIPAPDTESFANEDPAGVKIAVEAPVSTFSVDVDTASWAIVRSSLMAGRLPPSDAVRIEEMVNYFPYAYPVPEPGGAPFKPTISLSPTPWNPDTRILHIALQGELPAVADRPPLNLIFLIDTSGSMQDPNKLPLLKQSLRLLLGELRAEDSVAIVTYAGSAGEVLAPTPAGDRNTILGALDRLEAGGSTAGQAGLEQAYSLAERMASAGDVNRVLLATDGDFNVGLSDPEALKSFIAAKRESGTFLTVLGFGRGNLDDATMQALAQAGNGQAAYIDTLAEAQKVLVDQLAGQLFPIAQDVKVQMEFNPAAVAEYRLIGYETRALRREDFANDRVDAGEIGAGHQVTALYEVTPAGSPAALNEPLRYGQADAPASADVADELGFLRLRYKLPGGTESRLIELPIADSPTEAPMETRFATAVAGFGQLLRGSVYLGDWGYGDAVDLADGARGDDPFGYRAETLRLMRLAASLSPQDRP